MFSLPVILCVDDERAVLDAIWDQISQAFSNEFYCELAESGNEALELVEECIQDKKEIVLLISDQIMPAMSGAEFLIRAHELLPEVPKIMLTGQSDFESVINLINRASLYRYIPKPWQEKDLILTVREGIRSYQQAKQIQYHNRLLRSLNTAVGSISAEISLSGVQAKLIQAIKENTNAQDIQFYSPDSTPVIASNHFVISVNSNKYNFGCVTFSLDQCSPELLAQQYEAIHILISQAAVSFQNARLYNNLQDKNNELAAEKNKIQKINLLLEKAYQTLETKNTELLDSINYAKRIQLSILPEKQVIDSLFKDNLIFYQPKEIVSGDFYWWTYRPPHFFISAVDCTGHGVPGAFLSLIVYNLLNQALDEQHLVEPVQILAFAHTRLKNFLTREYGDRSIEAADVSLCRIHLITGELLFAGARRPLWIQTGDNQFTKIAGTRTSLGSVYGPQAFEQYHYQLQPNDKLYLFSDGLIDQLGGNGPRKIKFSSNRFQELLSRHHPRPLKELHQILTNTLRDWRKNEEQIDDIMVLALRFEV
jgi:serine phosphatase RsbU (regulator of sigma subunit)/FixJ family two-component response regulator